MNGLAQGSTRLPTTVGANSDPTTGESGHSTRAGNGSGEVNDLHIASNWSHAGMGRGKGSPMRAV